MPKHFEPNPVDVHVGRRLRALRKERGYSQQTLASAVGLTFQQAQKYERGANRISASKLYAFAALLKVSVNTFFVGLPEQDEPDVPATSPDRLDAIIGLPGGLKLVNAYIAMPPRVRSQFVGLAAVMATADPEA